ncbi:hypothetical protein FBALC1_00285 [Flavobacteriales bacterium ALC-1]|nr:hypothetical protein FBALC1_00285 [Flavobacteriales bacterium ALC-1]
MSLKRRVLFSTSWSSDNIDIEVNGGFLMSFYIKLFFKKWALLELKGSKYKVTVYLKEELSEQKVKFSLFNYSRDNNDKIITTSINKIDLFRAAIRSFYKFFDKNASVVGLSELYMSIIRKSIVEPIEYINYTNGWRLIHATVFKLENQIFIVSAGSKVGKSTLVSKLRNEVNCNVLSDNYCFIKDNMVRTIEEPIRGGEASKYKISFYGRTINGYPDSFEGEIDYFILMKRGNKNQLTNLDFKDLNLFVNQTNNTEREGVFYLNKSDSISVKNCDINFRGKYILKELEVAEGIDNIESSINLIKNI